MASRPNPLEPVIVNVSTLGVNVPADYTRVFGIVSYGDTGLEANTLKKVQRSTMSDLQLKADSYTEVFLNSYFGNNARGELYVLETKAQEGEGEEIATSDGKNYGVGDYFIKDAQAYKCIQIDSATSSSDLTPIHLTDTAYWNITTNPKAYAIGDVYSKDGINYKCIQADNSISATDLTPTNLTNTEYWYNTALKVYNINDIYRAEPDTRKKCLKMDFGISAEDPTPSKLAEAEYWIDDADTPKVYLIGDYFTDSTNTYECIQVDNGTDADNDTPVNLANTSYWTPLTKYEVGNTFDLNGLTYECIQADYHASIDDNTPSHIFDTAYWNNLKTYVIGEYYNKDDKNYQAVKNDKAVSLSNTEPLNLLNTEYWKDITPNPIADAVKVLSDFVNAGKVRVYEWACPTVFYDNEDFISLVKSFASITAGQYFSIELPAGTNPAADPTFALYTKSKSFIPVYPSSVSSESVNGAIVAIKSGSLYDLTSSNPLSPLQWKYATGITPQDELTNDLLDALNQNGCNWIGTSLNNICILGGMVGDGKSWEYYFALDTFIYQLIAGMGTRLISGSNAPSTAITFDQTGIDQVRDKLVAIATNMVALKVLLEFGSDYDATNRLILNVGEWNMIDYATYKSTQNEDWTNGMYNGASCYANIGKFILQVQPNITIE